MAGPQKKKRRRSRHHRDPRRAEIAAQREEARKRAREERRLAAIAEEKRLRRRKQLKRMGTWTVAGVGLAALALFLFRPDPEIEGVVISEESDVRVLEDGEAFDYGSAAPTSGPYLDGDPICGVFAEPVDPTAAVTALYYGAVVVWHAPELAEDEIAALSALATDAESHVVVSPNSGLDEVIVATSWNRLRAYDNADATAEFIKTYRKRGPASADCPVS
jgi:hypothetical protein